MCVLVWLACFGFVCCVLRMCATHVYFSAWRNILRKGGQMACEFSQGVVRPSTFPDMSPPLHTWNARQGKSISISGLVVEYIVAIDVTRVRFPADALLVLHCCVHCWRCVCHCQSLVARRKPCLFAGFCVCVVDTASKGPSTGHMV